MKNMIKKTDGTIDSFLNSKWITLWIFLLGMIVFTLGYRPEFICFQARFGLFAKEMLRNGVSFFPTTYGDPYPDYPSTSTILIWLVSLIPGKVTPLTAILPTAITSSLILVFTYKIAAIKDKMWGIYAILIALLTYDFMAESRSISLDQYSSLMTILCFYTVYSSNAMNKKLRLWLLPLFLIVGFAFRGPIGLVVPAVVIGGYYLWIGDYRKFMTTGILSIMLLALCFGTLLWVARMQGGEPFLKRVFEMQVGGRVGGHGRKPIYYYFLSGLTHYAVAYPLALLVMIYTFKDIIKKRDNILIFLGHLSIWMLIVVAGFTVASTKAMRYILPFAPAVFLMAAYIFINISSNVKLDKIKELFMWFCGALPVAAFFIGAGHLIYSVSKSYPFHWFYVLALILLGILFFVLKHIEKRWNENRHKNLAVLVIGCAAFIVLQIGFIEPIYYDTERTGLFVEKTISFTQQNDANIAFFRIPSDNEAIKFMVNLKTPINPKFTTEPSQLIQSSANICYIAQAKEFARLPHDIAKQMQVICEGKIGHKKCVAFIKTVKDISENEETR